jgi:hypothetical protein
MKKKTLTPKRLTPMSAVVAGVALAATGAHAQSSPIFQANFPASWNGTSTTVVDQTSAGDTGFQSGTATYSTTAVPPGAPAGTGSMVLAGAGGIKVTPTALLNNTAIANAGGFVYSVDFLWNGGTAATQKIIDYSGTESLQLNGGTGLLTMSFASDTGVESTPVSTTIVPNTWYDVTMTFYTEGNVLDGNGDISGLAALQVNGGTPITGLATKGTYGDGLNRPIGIGEFGYGHTTSILGLNGDIYNANVSLGTSAVPEPSTLALSLMGGVSSLGMMWNSRRRKT